MQKRRRFGGIRHNFLQFPLAIVRGFHPGVDLGRSTALEDQVHEDVEIAVDLLDLDLGRLGRRSPLHALAIHFARKFAAELLEQGWVHQMTVQSMENPPRDDRAGCSPGCTYLGTSIIPVI